MAQPSSSHHGEHRHRSDRERERERERSHHHHRTISSTTLLLVLSLVLAVLAVMLSLPNSAPATGADGSSSGVLGYLTPKRTQALINREKEVAIREAEVARREAELLVGAPGGVIPTPTVCPPCVASTTVETITGPVQTIIKEVVKEDSLAPTGYLGTRAEELLERELKIAERERDISKREESVNRREHDASRREGWIMEQLQYLGNDGPQHVDEEYVYEPVGSKRKPKYRELPLIVSETAYETETKTVVQTQTVTVPPPANTRLAANPKPDVVSSSSTPSSPKTTAVEIVTEEDDDGDDVHRAARTVTRGRAARRPPSRWFGGW